jgi:hypothetical protein
VSRARQDDVRLPLFPNSGTLGRAAETLCGDLGQVPRSCSAAAPRICAVADWSVATDPSPRELPVADASYEGVRGQRSSSPSAAEAAFGVDDLAGDPSAVWGDQPADDLGDVLRLAPAAGGER